VARLAVGLELSLAVASDPDPPVVFLQAATSNSAAHAVSATARRLAQRLLSAVIDFAPP